MKNKKKVLFVCQYFYPEKISSGVLPYELASKLAEDEFEVTALVGYPKEYVSNEKQCPKRERHNNILIKRISYIQANRKKTIGRIINMISFSVSVLFHPKVFKDTEIFISFTNPPLLPFIVSFYRKLFNKKFVVVMYDLYPDAPIKLGYLSEKSTIAKAFNYLNKLTFKNTDKVIALSSEMKEYLVKNKHLLKEKVEVIPNWYADNYSNCSYKIEFPIKILYGGNMGLAQDMKTIMETAYRLKDDDRFQFIFAGHGSKKEELKQFIETNHLKNCILHDFLEKEKYDLLLESCQLAILSLNENICGLGSPSKYYGYLALKKPVIVIMPEGTDVQQDIVNENIGLHVNSNEANILSEKLLELIKNPDQMKIMSKNAYKIFQEKYTLDKAVHKYKLILEELK